MKDLRYQRFVKRWEDVLDLPPQDAGLFTGVYRRIVSRLKVMPWPYLVVGALVFAVLLYLAAGPLVVWLVSLLQRGF